MEVALTIVNQYNRNEEGQLTVCGEDLQKPKRGIRNKIIYLLTLILFSFHDNSQPQTEAKLSMPFSYHEFNHSPNNTDIEPQVILITCQMIFAFCEW